MKITLTQGLRCDPLKLRFENHTNKKTLKQAWRFFLLCDLFVIAIGFEPMTVCLEGRCSIQLSYATGQNTLANQELTRVLAERLGFEPRQHFRVDRLAICSITTLAPLLWITKSEAKIHYQSKIANLFDGSIASLVKVIVLALIVFHNSQHNQCNTKENI